MAANPEAATRPAALCRAIEQCSGQCISLLSYVPCSTDGRASGAITDTHPGQGVCTSSANCTAVENCDTFTSCEAISKVSASLLECRRLGPRQHRQRFGDAVAGADCLHAAFHPSSATPRRAWTMRRVAAHAPTSVRHCSHSWLPSTTAPASPMPSEHRQEGTLSLRGSLSMPKTSCHVTHHSHPCHLFCHHSCPAAGETCRPLSRRTCVRHVCDGATATTTTVPCDGFCTRGTPPSLQSAQLANDGRSILLQFDQEVALADGTPRHAEQPQNSLLV